jgi:hypothetical protein
MCLLCKGREAAMNAPSPKNLKTPPRGKAAVQRGWVAKWMNSSGFLPTMGINLVARAIVRESSMEVLNVA